RVIREVTRYKGRVKEYDVINEPTHATTLQSIVGDSINWNCFKWAHEADPTAQLFINDYNVIEYQDQTNNYINLIKKILQNGGPISGIGAQCHIGENVDLVNFKSRFDQLAQFGIPVKVTEFDMNATNASQAKYAAEVGKMMRLCFSHPGIQGYIFWGFTEPTWAKGIVNVVREDKTMKIAADTIYQLIHKTWSTNLKGATNNTGDYTFKGYYGDYEIQAKLNGVWKKFDVSCTKDKRNSTITVIDSTAAAIPPKLLKVKTIAGKGVELTFDKPMTLPYADRGNFKVFESSSNYVSSALLKTGDSTTIVLTMSAPANIKERAYLPVAYFPGNVKSQDGGKLEFFGPVWDASVTPSYLSSKTSADGTIVNVIFDKKLKPATVNKSNFSVRKNSTGIIISEATLSATQDTVKLKLATQVTDTADVVSLSYTAGDLRTIDSVYVASVFNKSVTNALSVAKVSSVYTSSDGKTIYADFNSNIADPTGFESNFSLTINTKLTPITSVKLSPSNKRRLLITYDGSVFLKDSIKFALIKKGSFLSAIGVPVPLFSSKVLNKSVISAIIDVDDSSIKLCPNPFNDQIRLTGLADFTTVNVYNSVGVKVHSQVNSHETLEMNTSDLKQGLYFIEMIGKTKRKIVKAIKQ
ncbi:MAG TPA: endo-1,4-beta-xylanase, partial [Paludibacter sp.]